METTLLNKEYLEKNPESIGENLRLLAIALKETRGNLETIKTRSFWKKITCNNTKDLAEILLKQNDSISAFMTIVQGILFLSMNNLSALGAIMDSLVKSEEASELYENEYISMAKEYLTEALKTAKRTSNNEKELCRVKDELVDRYKSQALKDGEQDKKIEAGIEKDKVQDEIIHLYNKKIKTSIILSSVAIAFSFIGIILAIIL